MKILEIYQNRNVNGMGLSVGKTHSERSHVVICRFGLKAHWDGGWICSLGWLVVNNLGF